MKGQLSLEFLILFASMLFIYLAVLNVLAPQFNNAKLSFNALIINSITEQVAWKSNQVYLLNEGSRLFSNISAPFEFKLISSDGSIFSNVTNVSFSSKAEDTNLVIGRGVNELVFEKISDSVIIYSK